VRDDRKPPQGGGVESDEFITASWRPRKLAAFIALAIILFTAVVAGAVYAARPSVRSGCMHQGCGSSDAVTWTKLQDSSAQHRLLGIAAGRPTLALYAEYRGITGNDPALVEWFQSFAEPLAYPSQLALIAANRSLPIITWIPIDDGRRVPLAAIAAGRFDAYLERSARLARSFRGIVAIRFAHEMNLPEHYNLAGGEKANVFVAAWRHIVRVFRHAGADNVRWIWSPNVDCGGRCPFAKFYPGNAWVDAVGLDGYNSGTGEGGKWESMSSVFAESYRTLARLSSRPILITETGSVSVGGSRARWLEDGLLDTVPEQFPRVRAVILFDQDTDHGWKITPDTAAASALRVVARSPEYSS
jgi:mannan endo-1,4-beta-mannosidase